MSQLPGYPAHPQRFEVRPGLSMNYLDEGPRDGEVVVMVRQSVVELLLAHAGGRPVGHVPLHRAGPHRHGPVGQAGR